MRVDTERARNGYRAHHGRKYDDRLKRRNYRNDDYRSRANGNQPSRIPLKSHCYHNEEYSSSPSSSNRIGNGQSNFYDKHSSSSSSRFDRQTNNRDVYPPLLTDQSTLPSGLPPTVLYYNSSQSIRDRGLLSHYVDSERNRYPPPLQISSSSTYRRDTSPPPPPPSSYRDDYIPRSNGSDLYIREEYRPPTPPVLAPLSIRSTIDTYNDMYQANDYNNRSERYDIAPNRNGSSRDYAMPSVPSPVYRSDPYRKLSTIPISSSSPPLPLTSPSSYIPRDQYVQPLPSVREVDYRSRNYGMTTSMDHREIISNKSSDRYYDNYHSSSSYRDHPNLKRSRSNFNENASKRPMRR